MFLDVTPSYPEAGVSVDLYICPTSSGNMLLQGRGKVDASGRLSWRDDAGCPRTLAFTQDTATLTGPETGRCKPLLTDARVFRRDPARSPFLTE